MYYNNVRQTSLEKIISIGTTRFSSSIIIITLNQERRTRIDIQMMLS
jgi:hypothetical protein